MYLLFGCLGGILFSASSLATNYLSKHNDREDCRLAIMGEMLTQIDLIKNGKQQIDAYKEQIRGLESSRNKTHRELGELENKRQQGFESKTIQRQDRLLIKLKSEDRALLEYKSLLKETEDRVAETEKKHRDFKDKVLQVFKLVDIQQKGYNPPSHPYDLQYRHTCEVHDDVCNLPIDHKRKLNKAIGHNPTFEACKDYISLSD